MEYTMLSYLNNEIMENLDKEEKKYLEISKEIARDIRNGKLSILELVQNLGCLLVNNLYSKREMGVLLLSEVLKELEGNSINADHLDILSSYFAEKLRDHHQVATSALKGTLTLISFSNCSSKAVVQLITNLFNHITCQQQQQPDRYIIYQIYETVLTQHAHVVDIMQNEFVYGVISSVDGERDPKNLMFLFKWMQVFLKKAKLSHLTEEMFDVLACYFPVDFKAPPSDTNKITREDLAHGLCECLTCIPDFGQHAIPLALEKLDSALKIAKEDSLDILSNGCRNYSVETYKQFSPDISNQLQKHIFTVDDNALLERCKETLRAVVQKLESGNREDEFKKSIPDLTDSLKLNLVPSSKLFDRTVEYLLTVAQATALSSLVVVRAAGGFLRCNYQTVTDPCQKPQQLRAYVNFIKTAIENNSKVVLDDVEEIHKAPQLCLEALLKGDETLKNEALKGFSEIAGYIPEEVRLILFEHMRENIVKKQSDLRQDALFCCFTKMAEFYPVEVYGSIIYKDKIQSCTDLSAYIKCVSQSLINVTYFDEYLINTFSSYALCDVDSSKVIFEHLPRFLEQNSRFVSMFTEKKFISNLTDFLSNLKDNKPEVKWLLDIKHVLTVITRDQSTMTQRQTYYEESKKYYQQNVFFITVLSGIIMGLKTPVFQDNRLDFFLNMAINSTNPFEKDLSCQTLANVFNKMDQDALEQYLNKFREFCHSAKESDKIRLILWVTKGLVTRNHPDGWKWTDELVNMLNDNIDCSAGFRLIIRDEQNSFSIQNHSIIMPLYKQKFFVYVTNKLCELNDINKACYFNTVGYLIENAPRQAVLGQFKKITRLMFLCLDKSTDVEVLEIILLRLTEFIANKEQVIDNCLEDLLLRILNLTTFESSMRVRIAALKGLKEVTRNYPIYKLMPLQQKVIQTLGICIDDKKRIVRQEAADCRCLWYLLDASL